MNVEPRVGMLFWKLIVPRDGWVRHEIRAIDDGHVIFRRWVPARKSWFYEVEPDFIWKMGLRSGIPYAFSAEEARRATEKWKRELGEYQ